MSRASDTAYREIRGRILSGALAPGVQLKEEELASLCGVSRTPVREALRRLESDMLIRRTDTQRSFVPDWSPDEVDEIFALRGMLETHAAKRAATMATMPQLEEMRACNRAIGAAIADRDAPDLDTFVTRNNEFHGLVLAAARSDRLVKLRNLIIEQMIVRRTASRYDHQGLLRSHADHEELVAAFSRRDPDWAAAIMTSHIRRAAHAFGETGPETTQ